MTTLPLPAEVPTRRQFASVRGIVLDDGPERGTRALAFSTGGGLDFWVLTDRTMDIGPLWHRGVPLAWQHPAGFVAPGLHASHADTGTGIERTLSGLLVTCGLDNARQPARGLPLHGSLPLTPARLLAHGEDWNAPEPCLFAEGEAIQAHLSRTSFRLRRRIEAPIGGTSLRIRDRIENIGPGAATLRILYHLNFGFPAVGPGTLVELDGRKIHPATGEAGPAIACHRSTAPDRFEARLLGRDGLRVTIEGPVAAFPFVQIWSDPRPRRNVLAIEPANCDRLPDGTSAEGRTLAPGEVWTADLAIAIAP